MPIEAFRSDRALQLAVERALQIVGEAARTVSGVFREAHPEIPWREIIGMRNVLVHQYEEADPEVIWETVTQDLTGLIRQLDELLAGEESP